MSARRPVVRVVTGIAAAAVFAEVAPRAARAESVTLSGVAYTQNFDTLAASGTGTKPQDMPGTWTFEEAGVSANATYSTGNGSSTTADTYSFGSFGSTDRALGTLQSGTVIPMFGASFTNNIGSAITDLAISYSGEMWRLGATGRTVSTADRLDFQYSLDATSLATGTWVDVNALDLSTVILSGPIGSRDGNLAVNRATRATAIGGLNIADGATFWIRWKDLDAIGSDDGLAIDDFSLKAVAAAADPDVVVPVPVPLAAVAGAALLPLAALTHYRIRRKQQQW